MRSVLAFALAATCACRTTNELPPIAADHPASSTATETAVPELRGPASDVLKAAPTAAAKPMPSMQEGGR